jgi:beta-lactamase regulating signal transducer with metallopeptidase domain/peroxiredoxin
MKDLLAIVAQNTIMAGILAILVYGLTRVWRRPPVAHLLWLIVLAKLIGPPVLPVDMTGLFARRPAIESHDGGRDMARAGDVSGGQASFASLADPRARDAHPFEAIEDELQAASPADDEAGALAPWQSLTTMCVDFVCRYGNAALALAWIIGSGLCGAIALRRIIRFDRMIRGTLAAPKRRQALVAELAGTLGVRRVPDLQLIEGDGVPMVWWVGRRPIIAFPAGLIGELDDQQTSMVLAHELAHLCRRDHWVRGAELVISVLYWWNPMVGWVRGRLHEAEDLCCDAWVEWAFPGRRKEYAEVLFKAATLTGPTLRRPPALASSFLNHGVLKGRIEAVLEGGRPRHVSPGAAVSLAAAAIVLLPSFVPSVPAADVHPPAASPSQGKTDDERPRVPGRGKVEGTVTVKGTNEPVGGATVRVMLGRQTKGLSFYNDAVTATTDASGHYAIDVPFGHVLIGRFDAPPGYWSVGGQGQGGVLSAEAPVATRDFTVHRGPIVTVRVRDSSSSKPIPGIQCFVTRVDDNSRAKSWRETDAQGIARSTLPGPHGEFTIIVTELWNRTGQWAARPQKPSLTIEPGFRLDRVREMAAPLPAGTFRITDAQGKGATLRNARGTVVQGELFVDVDLERTDPAAIGPARGTVVDENGQPIAGARVGLIANGIGVTGVTANDGQFALRHDYQRGTDLSVAVIKDGFAGIDTRPMARPDDPWAPMDFGRIVLRPGKSLRVRVLDDHGKPVVGAWVEPGPGWAIRSQVSTTDERGECVIRNLPSGNINLRVDYGDSYANTNAVVGDGTAPRIIHLKPIVSQKPPATPPARAVTREIRSPGAVGQPAPALSVKEWTDGKTRSLTDYRGQVVFLAFWGGQDGQSGFMMPVIKKLDARYRDRGVVFLAVHIADTDIADVQSFLQQIPFNLLTAIDSGEDETAKRYGVKNRSALIVIGRDGRIAWNSGRVSKEDGLKSLERAARSLAIAWPIDENQPRDKLFEQVSQLQGFVFGEAIDRALAKL